MYIRSAKKRQRHSVDDNEPKDSIFESASDLNAVRDDGVFFMWILSNERFFVRILPMVTSRVYFRTALCATAALGR